MGSDNCGVTAQSRHEDRTVHRLGVFDVAGVKFCCRHTLRVVSWNRYRTNLLSVCVCVRSGLRCSVFRVSSSRFCWRKLFEILWDLSI